MRSANGGVRSAAIADVTKHSVEQNRAITAMKIRRIGLASFTEFDLNQRILHRRQRNARIGESDVRHECEQLKRKVERILNFDAPSRGIKCDEEFIARANGATINFSAPAPDQQCNRRLNRVSQFRADANALTGKFSAD